MAFNLGDRVVRIADGALGTIAVKPPHSRTPPVCKPADGPQYVFVEFDIASGAVPVFSTELSHA